VKRRSDCARRYENVIAALNIFAHLDFAALFALHRRMKPTAAEIFAGPATLKIGHESRRTFNDLTGKRGEGFASRCAAGVSSTTTRQNLRASRPPYKKNCCRKFHATHQSVASPARVSNAYIALPQSRRIPLRLA
jgi:hypothetical protein